MVSLVSNLSQVGQPLKEDKEEDRELASRYEEALAAHRRRRQVELKCTEMQEFMEDHG